MKSKNIEDLYELSPMQQGMLFHSVHDRDNKGLYVIQMSYALQGQLDVSAFEEAWRKVFSRQAILRTFFNWTELGKPLQVVMREVKLPLEVHDWRELGTEEQQERLKTYLQEDHRRGFDLDRPPLIRITVIRLGDDSYRFVWTFHHILFEGWSAAIILKDLFAYYRAVLRDEEIELEQPRPYRDYILWLQQQDIKKAEAYWRKKLEGFAAPTSLPVERLHGNPWAEVADYAEKKVRLPAEISKALDSFAKRHRLTLNTLVQGAWSLLLSRYSGEEDVVFGATVSGRPPELTGSENMVGLFINTLPVRAQADSEEKVLPWLQRLQDQLVELRQYEYSPLMEVQGWSQVRRGLPLFESILVFENWLGDISLRGLGEGLEIGETSCAEGGTGYPLTVAVAPGPEFQMTISYSTARFDAETVRRMLGHFQVLLESMAADSDQRLADLPLLTRPERHQLLVEWNNTRADFAKDACIHQLVEAQAERTPDAVAVVFADQRCTYRELNMRANQLAHRLHALGVGPEVLVGICVRRSLDMIVGMLAILKAGGAYVPLDPAYPKERLAFILEDTRAPVLLTQEHVLDDFPEIPCQLVYLDKDWEGIAKQSAENPLTEVTPDNLAYVIYTSGSTGRPKGVAIQHTSTVTLIHWAKGVFSSEEVSGMLASTSICFDLSVFEIFLPLSCGGKVIVVESALDIAEAPAAADVCLVNTVPSAIAELVKWNGLPPSVRTVCLAGEPLTAQLVEEIYRHQAVRRVFDLYGPSEDTTYSTFALRKADGPATIGRPIANTQIYLLDSNLQPVPVGLPGELYIGGDGLARGYLSRPDLTAERFVPSPFSEEDGRRLYRTGDLARYLPDGNIEFLGRIDHQVKIRGFRIELGEIEARLAEHPAIQGAVVMVREAIQSGKRLIAYIVYHPGKEMTTSELRKYLREKLPEYMIPAMFVTLEALPLTPNGKVDRRALPNPDELHTETKGGYVAPRTPMEAFIAAMWQELLGVRRVSVDDNFFDLGGHSLLLIRVITQIEKKTGLLLHPRQFMFQTLEQIAASCDGPQPS